MTDTASSMEAIMAALPAVREAVRRDIAGRIAAGEFIARIENGVLITSHPPDYDVAERRQQLLEEHAARLAAMGPMERKSAI